MELVKTVFLISILTHYSACVLNSFNCVMRSHHQLLQSGDHMKITNYHIIAELAELLSELLYLQKYEIDQNTKYSEMINCKSIFNCLTMSHLGSFGGGLIKSRFLSDFFS